MCLGWQDVISAHPPQPVSWICRQYVTQLPISTVFLTKKTCPWQFCVSMHSIAMLPTLCYAVRVCLCLLVLASTSKHAHVCSRTEDTWEALGLAIPVCADSARQYQGKLFDSGLANLPLPCQICSISHQPFHCSGHKPFRSCLQSSTKLAAWCFQTYPGLGTVKRWTHD